MQSRRYALEGRSYEEEIGLPMDDLTRNGTVLLGWDVGSLCSSEDSLLASDRDAVERMEFMNFGFHDLMRKPFISNRCMEHLGGEIGSGVGESVTSPTCMSNSNAIFVVEESGSMMSNSIMESNSPDSSFIDLNLGGLPDCIDANNGKVFDGTSVLSPVSSSLTAKRARMTNFNAQSPSCQVHGCNKDLSSSKDYHKRHKVCDAHSKAAKVIVNGIEKRFCQQCSRFHLLAEFDDGKRSCRKRLACHNERRRKTQFDKYSAKPLAFLQSYQGASFQGTSFSSRKPFVLSDKFHSGFNHSDRFELANWCEHVKVDHEPIYRPHVLTPIANAHLLPKPILPLHGEGKQYLSGIPSSGTENYSLFNTASTVQELFGVSNSSCALSLLSAHSEDFSSHLAGIPMASPMIIQGSHSQYNGGSHFDKSLGASSLENFTFCGSHSSGMNLMENDQMVPEMRSDARNSVNFGVHVDGIFQGSNRLNTKYCLSPEHEPTVDLLRLSSHLQRVEQQRNFEQVNKENEDLCYFPSI